MKRLIFFFTMFLVVSGASAFAQGCPLCKLSLIHSPEGRHMAKAFNSGILFLLSMPFAVGGTIGGTIYLHERKRRHDEKE